MILVFLMAWLAYKRSKANGRNGLLWALAAAGVFLGAQILVGAAVGLFMGVGVALWDWPETVFEDYIWPINIACIVASFLACWPLLRYLDRPLNQEIFVNEPPPPPPPQFARSVSEQNQSARNQETT